MDISAQVNTDSLNGMIPVMVRHRGRDLVRMVNTKKGVSVIRENGADWQLIDTLDVFGSTYYVTGGAI